MNKKSIAKWTLEAVRKEASKYPNKKTWEKRSPSSYNAALRNKWINEVSQHMKRPRCHNKKWDKEAVLNRAKCYNSKTEWQKSCGGSFLAAHRNGWIKEATEHMASFRGTNKAENEILDIVRKYYPSAKTARFDNNYTEYSFKRLEIDVYIPELNKGIEFDGEYWHRIDVLRSGRKNGPRGT